MNVESVIRVLVVDDHPVVCEGLRSLVASIPDVEVVGTAQRASEAVEQVRRLGPDVVLLDLALPDVEELEAIGMLQQAGFDGGIVIYSNYGGDLRIQRTLSAGARGYFLKGTPADELIEGIRKVFRGEVAVSDGVGSELVLSVVHEPLTSRELEVLRLIGEGLQNREIGRRLHISVPTVKSHVTNILGKLDARDRTQALSIALRRGLLLPP
ncbi:MAG: response regulator transcription factor [Acidobacteriota bacterium]|jgi:DNA-binding NarL/FixJ family response regulator